MAGKVGRSCKFRVASYINLADIKEKREVLKKPPPPVGRGLIEFLRQSWPENMCRMTFENLNFWKFENICDVLWPSFDLQVY